MAKSKLRELQPSDFKIQKAYRSYERAIQRHVSDVLALQEGYEYESGYRTGYNTGVRDAKKQRKTR